jgi:hypothetical protein
MIRAEDTATLSNILPICQMESWSKQLTFEEYLRGGGAPLSGDATEDEEEINRGGRC